MTRIQKLTATVAVLTLSMVGNAFALADSTTGIDWEADVATPALTSAKPAILAGLAVMVLFVAVAAGRKLWSKVTKTS